MMHRDHSDMAYAELHRPVPKVVIEPLGEPTLFDRIETALDRSWISRWGGLLLCTLTAVLIAVAVLNAAGV